MAGALKDTPIYTDQLIAWHNQRLWWVMLALLGLLALSVGDNTAYHLQPQPPPYVLEVNSQGEPLGQVLPVLSARAIPDAVLRARLADFIHDAYTIDRDPDEENYLFDHTQTMVTGQAAQKLDEWYHRDHDTHHPKIICRYTWADVVVTDTLKLAAPDSYQVDYMITTHENNDQTIIKTPWRAALHVIVGQSKDPESLGLFVDRMDSQQVKQ